MKRLTKLFQVLLGTAALILTALIAAGRLAWRTIRNWWKRRSKWLRRSIATVSIVIFTGFLALISYAWYLHKYGRMYWRDITLSKNVELHGFRDYKFRVYNNKTGEYTTPKLYWLTQAQQEDSLAVYAIPYKRGYINVKNGEIAIDAKSNNYQKAWVFSEGVAAVMSDDKIGFINTNNEVVIPFVFNYSEECRMENFAFVFHDGCCAMTGSDGKIGLIDKCGNWVLEPAYDEIWAPRNSSYRVIVDNGKYGVITNDGKTIYPAEYEYINIKSDGFVLSDNGKQWQVDFEGNVVQPFMFESTTLLNYPTGYNEDEYTKYALSEYVRYGIMDKYGIMNRITSEVVTPAIYSEINMLSEKLFEVQEYGSHEWCLLNICNRQE